MKFKVIARIKRASWLTMQKQTVAAEVHVVNHLAVAVALKGSLCVSTVCTPNHLSILYSVSQQGVKTSQSQQDNLRCATI